MYTNAPRAVRALRRKRGWTQSVLGVRAGVSRETVSRLERGKLSGMPVASIERIVAALDASTQLMVRWNGAELDRLLDAAHATLQEFVADQLRRLGWLVRVEVGFNHFGDRGRVDIVAFHPIRQLLLVVEIKTAIGDVQDTVGTLLMKVRLGHVIAREAGWPSAPCVPLLVIRDGRAARRVVAQHPTLFGDFTFRGREAVAWLRRPVEPVPTGLLWFAKQSDSHALTDARARRPIAHPDSRHA